LTITPNDIPAGNNTLESMAILINLETGFKGKVNLEEVMIFPVFKFI
jgi:glutaredoxin 2